MKSTTNTTIRKAMKTYHDIALHPKCDDVLLYETRKLILSIIVSMYVEDEIGYDLFLELLDDVRETEDDYKHIKQERIIARLNA